MTGAPAAAGSRGAAASALAVAGGFGGNVFPAASAGMMAGVPAAAGSRGAAPVVASGSGGNAFPAESAGIMAGTPAAAGSSGAAFQAASSAVRPPPAAAFASDDHGDCQVRRTATATRRQAYEVTPAMTRSRSRSISRHDGVSGALHLANNLATTPNSKHMDIRHHFIRERVANGEFRVVHVRSDLQRADFLTKPLHREAFCVHCNFVMNISCFFFTTVVLLAKIMRGGI